MAGRILVLGAGLAGLVAAHELTRAGHDVIVLEARDRPGGRVLTLRDGFAGNLYVEAGARYVPANHAHTIGYLRHFGIGLQPLPAREPTALYYLAGRRVLMRPDEAPSWPVELTPAEQALGPDGLLYHYLGGLLAAVGDPSAPDWPPPALLPYDALSLDSYLRQAGASAGAVALMGLGGILNLVGEGLESLSLLWVLRHLAGLYSSGQMYVIEDGSDRLPRAFAAGLTTRIRYNAPVVRITHGSDGVAVTHLDEGTPRTVSGAYLVCTIPFPVLRGMTVEPAFSAEKTRAIDQLSTTAVTRVFLQARTRVWEEQRLPDTASTDGPLGVCMDVTALQPGRHGIIESYQAGAAARHTGSLSLPEQLARTRAEMDNIYPGIAAACDGGASYAWEQDQWARGGYAWSRPGQMAALEPHVGTPEGRVFFAGDHASPWPGWMQGALWSGLRTAQAIIAAA